MFSNKSDLMLYEKYILKGTLGVRSPCFICTNFSASMNMESCKYCRHNYTHCAGFRGSEDNYMRDYREECSRLLDAIRELEKKLEDA